MATLIARPRLIRRILKELGKWQAGQDLAPEDYQSVDEELDPELAAMAAADIFVVEDPKAGVPAEAYSEIAVYMAGQMVGVFGIAGEEAQGIAGRAGLAEKALRYLKRTQATYQPMRVDYF